jgi:transposase
VRTLKPAPEADPVVRFETELGRQMQVDWIEFKRERLAAFVAAAVSVKRSYTES